jgi:homoserine kinase
LIWSQSPSRVRAPATSANLGPGFDTLGLALSLHDEIEARLTDGGLAIEVAGEGRETAAAGERHLVVRSMRAAFDALGGQPRGIAVRCVNAIPHGRGLGSSAAAICSGLLAARALVSDGRPRLPDDALFQLAVRLEGHPDNVAACLTGGLTIAWIPRPAPLSASPTAGEAGQGEAGQGQAGPRPAGDGAAGARLLPIPVPATLRAVACVPAAPLLTEQARRVLPPAVPHADAAANAARSALLVAALSGAQGAPEVLLAATEDFLHQPYRAPVMPETAGLMDRLRRAGLAAVVSGAGPTVLVLSFGSSPSAKVVDSIARETGIAWRVIPLDIDRQGAHIQHGGLGVHPPGSARRESSWHRVQGLGAGQAGGSPLDQQASSATHRPQPRECRGLS